VGPPGGQEGAGGRDLAGLQGFLNCKHMITTNLDHKSLLDVPVSAWLLQATEPATLIPLTRGAQCVVMAGDPRQLPPTVVSQK
jgi:hypothetical protein